MYIFVFFIFLTSCKKQVDNCIKTTFYSQDSLYKITFDKPIELDTLYRWLDADCTPCGEDYKYRYSKKNYPLLKESGWIKGPEPDSIYQITFRHVNKFQCKTENILNSQELVNVMKNKWKYERATIDTIFIKDKEINGFNYNIIGYILNENYDNKYLTHVFKIWTIMDGYRLDFTAECKSNKCKDFIERMEKSFQTIEIEKLK